MFFTRLSASRAAVSDVLVAHHAAAVDRPVSGAAEDAVALEFGDQRLGLARRDTGKAGDLVGGHRLAVDDEVAVGLAVVGDVQHLAPQAARGDGAGLDASVLAPVAGIPLICGALRHAAILFPPYRDAMGIG